jgi:hypothetical protein
MKQSKKDAQIRTWQKDTDKLDFKSVIRKLKNTYDDFVRNQVAFINVGLGRQAQGCPVPYLGPGITGTHCTLQSRIWALVSQAHTVHYSPVSGPWYHRHTLYIIVPYLGPGITDTHCT